MRVAFVHKLIFDYRLSFYEAMGSQPDLQLTVMHSGKPMALPESSFDEVILAETGFGGVAWQHDLRHLLADMDVVVYLFDIRYLSTVWRLVAQPAHQKTYLWGIGMGNSRVGRWFGNRFRVWLVGRSDGIGVYMPGNQDTLIRAGVAPDRVFVAPNTISIEQGRCPVAEDRRRFVFLGSLKPRKRLEQLFQAFALVRESLPETCGIDVLGGGDIEHYRQLAAELGIDEAVSFQGHVQDEATIGAAFDQAIACVSPGQIGLTVLHSFAFGTPFVTSYNAITGGEIENLKHAHRGLFYDGSTAQLGDVLQALANTPGLAQCMGENAWRYYHEHMQLDTLINAFLTRLRPPAGVLVHG